MSINLPKFDIKIRKTLKGKAQVFDTLRNKYVALTPEEWVRQHFVNFLVNYLHYPSYLMANEVGIRLNGTLKRCDTVVYDATAHPMAIVEYKAPTVAINAKVFDQIVRYNMVLGVEWLMVSNGMDHFCCRINHKDKSYQFLKQLPDYAEISSTDSLNHEPS